MISQKHIFLDRDGVINKDSDDYIKTAEEWDAFPRCLVAIKKVTDNFFQVINLIIKWFPQSLRETSPASKKLKLLNLASSKHSVNCHISYLFRNPVRPKNRPQAASYFSIEIVQNSQSLGPVAPNTY